ncbi:hypothetical protein M9H77_00842 [Catharanthus roseus]|uniref:Uncharacterized protein n=1 Tax=Catharanthus roseus TaxID=4058 RepID=A0ACC0C407_CATRO|nr:hypothetical protein M9H77_00842 [Catharanthus roseus]
MRVSSSAGKSERIKTHQRSSMPNFKRTCNATVGLHRQSPDPQNEAIGTKFRHLVVKYQPNNIRALDYKQPHSHNTGQNRLQTPGAPTRFRMYLQIKGAICPAIIINSTVRRGERHLRGVFLGVENRTHVGSE